MTEKSLSELLACSKNVRYLYLQKCDKVDLSKLFVELEERNASLSLKEIRLDNLRVENSTLLRLVKTCPGLEALHMSRTNEWDEGGLEFLCHQLPSLKGLSLGSCKLTSQVLNCITNSNANIRFLYLK